MTRRDFLKASAAVVAALPGASCTGRPPLRFGFVTDPHYADIDPIGTRNYRRSLAKMEECVAFMNAQRVSFLVEGGDFKDEDRPGVEAQTLRYLQAIEARFGRFDGPRYHVLGNHDLDSLSKAQFLAHTVNTGVEAGRTFYAFEAGPVRGVVLDATYRSDGADYDHGNFDWQDANLPSNQLDWLARELAADLRPVVVFVHQRLDGEGDVFINNAPAVRSVLEEAGNVLAVFQGHDHAGAHSALNGIHYYTLKAMVEGAGEEDNAYAVVEVQADYDIVVRGYRKAVSMELGA
jgi:hypothetical protein